MTTIKTLLFDLDGTLIDSRVDLASAVNFALKSAGRPMKSQDEIIPHVGNGLRILLGNVMGPSDSPSMEKAIAGFSYYYLDHCVDKTTLYDGVRDTIESFSGKITMGIVTNKPKVFSEMIIKSLGLAPFISFIIGGDSLPERKPHPAPLFEALKALNGSPTSALMLGDGPQDIQAGHAAGTQTAVARYGYGYRPETLDLKPDYVVDRFTDLKEIVGCH